jgi:hypothetical protein
MSGLKLSLPHIHLKQKAKPELYSMQILHAKLSQNTLTEFKIGFDEKEFRSKHEVKTLIKIIQDQYLHKLETDKYSCLESIRIGWRLPRYALGPILEQVTPLLLEKPTNVQHLQLILNAWVPESTLKRLVSWHTLKSLDLHATRIRSASEPRRNRRSSRESVSVVDVNILRIVPHISMTVETLKLVDCNLLTHDIPKLCGMLRKRRRLQHLSLRFNRYLDGGWECLLSLPFLKTLDISICDLDPADGFCIAQAIEKSQSCTSLSVAGNYRMALAIPKLVQVSATRLIELDCSFCDVQNKFQKQVFDILATTPNCTIRSLRMQASRIKNTDSLIRCIRQNTSLKRLIVDHPKEPFPVDSVSLKKILDALQYNYYLQIFRVDTMMKDRKIVQEMEFWLQLNRCGRSILLQDNNNGQCFRNSWAVVLGQAALREDINVLFWLLKHGAGHF